MIFRLGLEYDEEVGRYSEEEARANIVEAIQPYLEPAELDSHQDLFRPEPI